MNEKIRKHKEKRLHEAKLENFRRNKINNKVESNQSDLVKDNIVKDSSKTDFLKIKLYVSLGLTLVVTFWIVVAYHWIFLIYIAIPVWFLIRYLLKKINYYNDRKCTNCKMWDSVYIDSRDCINEWSGWETRYFDDVTRNTKGETISTTSRRQQVWVTNRKYLIHCKCKNCGDYYNYEKTSSFY